MISKIRHTGIVVRNIKNIKDFYEGLGFSTFIHQVESGDFIDRIVGMSNSKIETIKMKSPCGSMIELLEYQSHPSSKKIKIQASNKLGCSHIALTVNDIDNVLKFIKNNGGYPARDVAEDAKLKLKVAYCHDPEGNLLEIVEENNV